MIARLAPVTRPFPVSFSRRLFLACLLTVAFWSGPATCKADFPIQSGDRVLFIGDSITQDGRYVDLIQGYLWTKYSDRKITIINAGLSSETVSGITEPIHPFPRPNVLDRIDRILQLAKPDLVFVCYGMNDGIYHPVDDRIREAYRFGLEQVLSKIDSVGAKAYLLSPPVFDVNAPSIQKNLANAKADEPFGYRKPYEMYDMTLVSLTNIMQSYETDPRVAGYIDVHASTHDFLMEAKQADPNFVYGDGVHPPLEGHAAMARGVLFGLGEPMEAIEQVFGHYFDVRFPGVTKKEIPAGEQAAELREMLFKRGKALSAEVRKLVNPKEDGSGIAQFGESQAVAAAKEAEGKILAMIDGIKREF